MEPIVLENMLNERLEATHAEKLALKDALDSIEIKIKSLVSRIGQRPKESESSINEQAKQIEYEHSTKPQNNADERKFMRDLEKLKQKKKIVLEYNAMQEELDEYKNKKSVLLKELKEKERNLDDLYQGVRKLKASVKLGCSTSEIAEKKIVVPEDRISRVIGKGGANVKLIENECNVTIDSDRGGYFRINGKEEGILAAEEKLNVLINTVSEEFSILEEAIVCLTLGKASLLQQIQSLYGVRIDMSKPKRLCNITGLPENVAAARAEIAAIRCSRVELPFEDNILPFIIGKGGATIRALENEHSVQLDVSRESHRIVILGFEDDVRAAGNMVSSIIDENKEVEESLAVDRNIVLTCIIGAKGAVIRELQKDLSVYIHSKRDEEQSETELLVIRGTAANVIPAKAKIQEMINEFKSQTDVIHFDDELVPQLVGRKGARITTLREEHPSVQIDVDATNCCVRLHGADDDARTAAKNAILDVIMANQRAIVYMDHETTVALKGARGAALRTTVQNELGLNMDILSAEETVRVRGEYNAVQRAVAMLEEFRENNFTLEIPCFDEDSNALFGGGENSPGKHIELKFHVEISHDRKKGILRIRGNKASVDLAEAAITHSLEGGEDGGTKFVEADAYSMGALIGRGGTNIKKLETQHNVHLDILRSRGVVRIRGEPGDVDEAKKAVIAFIQALRIVVPILRPAGVSSAAAIQVVTRASSLFFGVDMEATDYEVILRGPQRMVLEAKKYITENFSDSATAVIKLSEGQFAVLEVNAELNFKQIQDIHKVSVEMDSKSFGIVLSGPAAAVLKAQLQTYRMLDYLFPDDFASVAMDVICVAEAGAYSFAQKVLEATGAVVEANAPLQCVRIRGSTDEVAAAKAMIEDMQSEWRSRAVIMPVQEYMIPLILGKKGSNITALENETSTSISIDRLGKRLIIIGSAEEQVKRACMEMNSRIEKLHKEHWEITLDERLLGPMIGKQGSNVNKLRQETGANIELEAKTSTVKVSGPPEKVALAKEKILAFIEEQKKEVMFGVKVRVPATTFPMIIGVKGATVLRIQSSCGVRLDLDRAEQVASIKGSPEGCAQAVAAIRELVEQEGLAPASVSVISSGTVPLFGTSSTSAVDAGSINDITLSKSDAVDKSEMANLQAIADRVKAAEMSKPNALSKSALKRLRKKTKAEDGDADGEAEEAGGVAATSASQSTPTPLPLASGRRLLVADILDSMKSATAANDAHNGQASEDIQAKPAVSGSQSHTALAAAAPPAHAPKAEAEAVVPPTPKPATQGSSPVSSTLPKAPSAPSGVPAPEGKTNELLAMLLGSGTAHTAVPAHAVMPPSAPSLVKPAPAVKHTGGLDVAALNRLSTSLGLPPTALTSAGAAGAGSPIAALLATVPAAAANASKAPAANGSGSQSGSSQYFKSKSGFTVRL